VDQEDMVIAMKRLALFLSAQKSLENSKALSQAKSWGSLGPPDLAKSLVPEVGIPSFLQDNFNNTGYMKTRL
jgi:hypothetical protein